MGESVFFSYAHVDAAAVRPIVDALRAAGLEVWLDEDDVDDFASITRAITDGLARCKVLVAYYSVTYPTRRACQWELTAAYLAAQREGDARRRVLVINPEPSGAHIEPAELRDARFVPAPEPGDVAAQSRLVDAIAGRVRELEGTLGDIQALSPRPWFGFRGLGSERFAGRLQELWKLHTLLQGGDTVLITGRSRAAVAQVRGLGGIGKSLLAEEYALRFAAAYPGGVFWLRAFGSYDDEGRLDVQRYEAERQQQVRAFAGEFGLELAGLSPPEVGGKLRAELERPDQACLWIVDDLPAGLDEETRRRWFAPHPLARTLVTTRSRGYDASGVLGLGVLEAEDAYRLLTARRQPDGEAEEAEARGVVEDLGRHALAVDVAGGALASQRGLATFASFRAELGQTGKDVLELAKDLGEALPNGHEKSIAATLLRSIGLLEETGRDVLRLASILAGTPIQASLVAQVLASVDELDESTGRDRAAVGLDQAKRLSLIEVDEAGASTVHALVARTVRLQAGWAERTAALHTAAIRVLTKELPGVMDARRHGDLAALVAHARELTAAAQNEGEADLLGWVANFDYVRGDLVGARVLHEKVLEVWRGVLGDDHPETLSSMNNLALTLQAQGDLAGARALQEKVLEVQRRVLGDDRPETLASMNNLAATLQAQGDLAGARALQEKAIEVSRRVLGDDHPGTTISAWNLSQTYEKGGDVAAARRIRAELLAWLLERDPAELGAHQRQIREELAADADATGRRPGLLDGLRRWLAR